MRLDKFHGAQNDFLFWEVNFPDFFSSHSLMEIRTLALKLCHRNKGIGADGLVLANDRGEVVIVNADGSFAGTCGNALRCLGLWLFRKTFWSGQTPFKIKRPHLPSAHSQGLTVEEIFQRVPEVFGELLQISVPQDSHEELETIVEVDVAMGPQKSTRTFDVSEFWKQTLHNKRMPDCDLSLSEPPSAVFVELQNPHLVLIHTSFHPEMNFSHFGSFLQKELPKQFDVPVSNIGFLTPNILPGGGHRLVVYERGAGLTACCGSGAVAAYGALEEAGLFVIPEHSKAKPVRFRMPGGEVFIYGPAHNRVLRGPAAQVARLELK
jgi:diaminopimelate epimerase